MLEPERTRVIQEPTPEERERAKAEYEATRAQRFTPASIAARQRPGALGIPKRFEAASLETWDAQTPAQQRVLGVLRRFVSHFAEVRAKGASLLFRGNVGAGKTTLGCALCHGVVDAGYSATYVHQAGKFYRQMREAFGASDQQRRASQVMDALVTPDLLVLDELGVQFNTKTELVLLTELIDDRYAQCRPTVLVTNLPNVKLVELVGERAADRMREHGLELVFDWPSFRCQERRPGAP